MGILIIIYEEINVCLERMKESKAAKKKKHEIWKKSKENK